MKRISLFWGLSIFLALVTACSSQSETPPTPDTPSSTEPTPSEHFTQATPSFPDLEQFTPPPSGLVDETTGEDVTPATVPTWSASEHENAIQTARHVLETFAQPEATYETWWSQLEPLLTPGAAQDYAYVVPEVIPVSKILSDGVIIDDASAHFVIVEFTTDAGRYHILMSRTDGDAPWLATRISPIEEP